MNVSRFASVHVHLLRPEKLTSHLSRIEIGATLRSHPKTKKIVQGHCSQTNKYKIRHDTASPSMEVFPQKYYPEFEEFVCRTVMVFANSEAGKLRHP